MGRALLLLVCLTFFGTTISFGQDNEKGLYDTDKVTEIRIEFKSENWAGELDSLRLFGDELLLGNLTIDGVKLKNVGVRYRGSKTFTVGGNRNPLYIKLNFIEKKQRYQGQKTLKFSNALRDPSMVREVLGYEIARKYMAAPRANFATVYINNTYYGLMVNIEPINDAFLKTHFGSSDNTFIKCAPDTKAKNKNGCKKNTFASLVAESDVECYFDNYELKSEEGWDDLMELTKKLEKGGDNIEKILDVESTLWMLAFNNVIVNLSSYSGDKSQNFYLYQGDDNRFVPIIWDMNLAFGSYKNTGKGSDLSLSELQKLDPLLHVDNNTKPLISSLLKIKENKKLYITFMKIILNENFRKGQYADRAEELQRLITVPFYNDQNKKYTSSQFKNSLDKTTGRRSKIPGIVQLMKPRSSFLKKHRLLRVIGPKFDSVDWAKRGTYSPKKLKAFTIFAELDKYTKGAEIFYRFDESKDFKVMKMMDDGKNGDIKAKDNIFSVRISPPDKKDELEYYIRAENAAIFSFFPENYRAERKKLSLIEVNY